MYNKKRFIDIKKKKKIRISILYYNNDEYEFEFRLMADPDRRFIKFENSIVYREVSRFLTNSRFLENFYNTYAKIYYTKMASTVRNYTVESISLKSSIFPFEAAFTDFMNQYNDLDNVIDEITSNVL